MYILLEQLWIIVDQKSNPNIVWPFNKVNQKIIIDPNLSVKSVILFSLTA